MRILGIVTWIEVHARVANEHSRQATLPAQLLHPSPAPRSVLTRSQNVHPATLDARVPEVPVGAEP